jgi:hypothetical protein
MDEQINQPESYIQIVFKEVNSVEFMEGMPPRIFGVSSLQLFAVAEYLRITAERDYIRKLDEFDARMQQNKIVVPGMDLDHLGV